MNLVLTLAVAAAAASPPAGELAGAALAGGRVVKLELDAALLTDSNPTGEPLAVQRAGLAPRLHPVAAPGTGASVAPSFGWVLQRKSVSAAVRVRGFAWAATYLANGQPPGAAQPLLSSLPREQGYAPRLVLGVDASADGTLAWRPARRVVAATAVEASRSTAPSPELLGTPWGRSALAGVERVTRRVPGQRLWAWAEAGARAEALDRLPSGVAGPSPAVVAWERPGWDDAPVARAGAEAWLGAGVEHELGRQQRLLVRTQAGAGAWARGSGLDAVSAPLAVAGGWTRRWGGASALEAELGVWVPGTACPSPALADCRARLRAPRRWDGRLGELPDARGWLPLPAASLAWTRGLGRAWTLQLRAAATPRLSPFYAYADDKHLEAALAGPVGRPWQVGARLAGSVLSYGPPLDGASTRAAYPWGWRGGGLAWRTGALRLDLAATAALSARWALAPWLAVTAQQDLWLLLTNAEARTAGGWANPSMARSTSAAGVHLQW